MRGARVDLSRIPYDDEPTYDAIQVADTMGVFQIESRAQMASLLRTRPRSLEDLTIQVAIVRPGPILGGAVNPYISRLQTLRENPTYVVPYEHQSLEPVLKDTLGTIIFQDQVIEVAMAFAGFSPGEAEGLRRAMSRKRSAEAIEAYHQRFLDGARGHPRRRRGGRRARLRHDRRLLGLRLPEGPRRRLRPARLPVHLAARPPRPGVPLRADERAADGLLRAGHAGPRGPAARDRPAPAGRERERRAVHGRVGAGAWAAQPPPRRRAPRVGAAPLAAARHRDRPRSCGSGSGSSSGCARTRSRRSSRRARRAGRSGRSRISRRGPARGGPSLDRLAWAGACDSLIGGSAEHARRTALWQLGVAVPGERLLEGTQLSLPLEVPDAPELRPLTPWESMIGDYATTGLTLGPHPMQLLRPSLEPGTLSIGDLARLPHNTPVSLGGLVVARQRPGTAKGIVFLLLEDEFGTINLIVPPDLYEANRLTVRVGAAAAVRGPAGEAAAGGRRDQRLRQGACGRWSRPRSRRRRSSRWPRSASRRRRPAAARARRAAARRPRRSASSARSRRRSRASRPDGDAKRPRERVDCGPVSTLRVRRSPSSSWASGRCCSP